MTTPQQNPTELVAIFLKGNNGREELRFLPTCSGCGKIVLNIAEANVAVAGVAPARLRRIGTHRGTGIFRESGRAFVFCWKCDGKQTSHNVPWLNALSTFRGLDEPQRSPELVRKVTPR